MKSIIQKERIAAFFLSAIITIALIGSMIIIHEESSEFKDFLVSLTGHHWLTKSVIAAILFPILSFVFYFAFGSERIRERLKTGDVWLWSITTVAVTVVFMLGTFITYLLHYLEG